MSILEADGALDSRAPVFRVQIIDKEISPWT